MPNVSVSPHSVDAIPGAGFRPAERLLISTPEQLRTISDPLRLSIIEMIAKEALTVKQIARHLNQPATKLYYHVAELEEAGFVTLVDTRVKSGIIEKYFRATSINITVDRKLLDISGAPENASTALISLALDSTIQELSQSMSAGLVDMDISAGESARTYVLSRTLVNLRHKDAMIFVEKFHALLAELQDVKETTDTDTISYACLVALYPRSNSNGQASF